MHEVKKKRETLMTINKTPNLERGREYKTTIYIAKNKRDAAVIYDFLFMICVRLVNSHIITNLRESVCPGLLHRQFVFIVNTYVCRLILKSVLQMYTIY